MLTPPGLFTMSPHLAVCPKTAEVGDCVPTPNQASGSYDKCNDILNLFQQMFIKHLLWAKDLVIVCVYLGGAGYNSHQK